MIENPAVQFTLDAKAGEYDEVSDETYNFLLNEVEELSKFWCDQKEVPAVQILGAIFRKMNLDQKTIGAVAERLADRYAEEVKPFTEKNIVQDEGDLDWLFDMETEKKNQGFSPKEIYKFVSDRIYGQDRAVKAATMLLYNHIHAHKRNILFAGPTGCGKTEIWRVMSRLYPNIRIIDSTMLTMQGWSGSFKVRDIFSSMSQEEAEKAIIVFDEFDKFCEPLYGSNGTNYGAAAQNELLKLIEGGQIYFPADKGKPALELDSSGISFVFCGSFERLTDVKTESESSMGFGNKIQKKDAYVQYEKEITVEDLVRYAGIRQEIGGRINQIVQLQGMTAEDYKKILQDKTISPLHQLERQYGVKLRLGEREREKLAQEAERTKMGVRYLRSKIQQMLDEQLFQNDEQDEYELEL